MYKNSGIVFCGPREVRLDNDIPPRDTEHVLKVYEALSSSAIVVYVLLVTQNLLPVWIYSYIVTRRSQQIEIIPEPSKYSYRNNPTGLILTSKIPLYIHNLPIT